MSEYIMNRNGPNKPNLHRRVRPRCLSFAPDERFNSFHNPYSYGAPQYDLGPLMKTSVPYELYKLPHNDTTYPDRSSNPNGIRNISVENSLLYQTATSIPGQRSLTETDFDRFNLLPFDPQDTRHIVWKDDMPRSGFSTRSDRLDYCFE